MEKIKVERPPIANAADYIDALARPEKLPVVEKTLIEGRRMRDKYLNGVLVVVQPKESR
jgi:hypothetical protein